MYFYVIMLLTIIADQVTKIAVRHRLKPGESTDVLGGLFHLTRYENTGSSANMFHGYGRLLVLVTIAAVGVVIYYRRKGKLKSPYMQVATSLFLAGAIGNAIDRLVFNRVTDFLSYFSDNEILNIADLGINIGILMIVTSLLVKLFKPEAPVPTNGAQG
jgi:signal peptidase II